MRAWDQSPHISQCQVSSMGFCALRVADQSLQSPDAPSTTAPSLAAEAAGCPPPAIALLAPWPGAMRGVGVLRVRVAIPVHDFRDVTLTTALQALRGGWATSSALMP